MPRRVHVAMSALFAASWAAALTNGCSAAGHKTGFTNTGGDHLTNGVPVITNFKGPGKHRAVYQLSP